MATMVDRGYFRDGSTSGIHQWGIDYKSGKFHAFMKKGTIVLYIAHISWTNFSGYFGRWRKIENIVKDDVNNSASFVVFNCCLSGAVHSAFKIDRSNYSRCSNRYHHESVLVETRMYYM